MRENVRFLIWGKVLLSFFFFFALGRMLEPSRIYQLGGMPFGGGDVSDFLPIAVKGDCLAQAVPLFDEE